VALDSLAGTLVRVLPATPAQVNDLARLFVVGQTLKGIVLRALPEGQTLVNFAGQYVLMAANQPMARGQTFVATVEQTSPSLVLRLGSPPAPLHTAGIALPTDQRLPEATPGAAGQPSPGTLSAVELKSYLVAKQPFGEMLTSLQEHVASSPVLQSIDPALQHRLAATLTALLPDAGEPPDASKLKAQVDRAGINYEAKVLSVLNRPDSPTELAVLAEDLKGQLLELLKTLEHRATAAAHAQDADSAELRYYVQQALRNIEFQQLANVFAQQEHQPLLLQLAHPAFHAAHTARLYFRVDDGGQAAHEGAQQGYTLVFLLDFTVLGPVRIDATVHGPYLSTMIRTADEAVANFIAARTPTLTARLSDLGFQAEIHCQAEAHVPLEVEDSLTRLLVAEPSRLVDIKA
jgi:hypothetical protein